MSAIIRPYIVVSREWRVTGNQPRNVTQINHLSSPILHNINFLEFNY